MANGQSGEKPPRLSIGELLEVSGMRGPVQPTPSDTVKADERRRMQTAEDLQNSFRRNLPPDRKPLKPPDPLVPAFPGPIGAGPATQAPAAGPARATRGEPDLGELQRLRWELDALRCDLDTLRQELAASVQSCTEGSTLPTNADSERSVPTTKSLALDTDNQHFMDYDFLNPTPEELQPSHFDADGGGKYLAIVRYQNSPGDVPEKRYADLSLFGTGGSSPTDELVKVDSSITDVAQHLEDKLVAGDGIAITKQADGLGVKTLEISTDGDVPDHDHSSTPGQGGQFDYNHLTNRTHGIADSAEHSTSGATEGNLLAANANGLPVDSGKAASLLNDAHARKHFFEASNDHEVLATLSGIHTPTALLVVASGGYPYATSDIELSNVFHRDNRPIHGDGFADIDGIGPDDHHTKAHRLNDETHHTPGSITTGYLAKGDANALPVTSSVSETDAADAVSKRHARGHDLDGASDHNALSGGTSGNILVLSASLRPADGGAKIADLTTTSHNHNSTGSNGPKLTQANTHESADTDVGTSSLHHTLGTGANQAAAGNHAHAGVYLPANPASITGYSAGVMQVLTKTTDNTFAWVTPSVCPP